MRLVAHRGNRHQSHAGHVRLTVGLEDFLGAGETFLHMKRLASDIAE